MYEAFLTIVRGLPVFTLHSATGLGILIGGILVYTRITPHDELALIRAGNVAAALSLGGAMLGLALPISFALATSVSVWDLLFWGVVGLVFQLVAFRVVDLVLHGLSHRIEAGELGPAILLVCFKLATACINAAAIAG
ncbi:MAG TPA: DUF350 domain-containing protein [Vicinamibacteria bacterium]|nr:DUF350 domain-containing protein [Vicinamibacteria bacterium]